MTNTRKKPIPFPVQRSRTLGEDVVEGMEIIIEGIRDGSITALAVAARQDGYGRRGVYGTAITEGDRINIIGQLHCLINDLVKLGDDE